MYSSKFNSVAIFNAIPEEELNTAGRLRDELDDIAVYIANDLKVRYFRINDPCDIESGVSALLNETKKDGLLPWIHLDAHGMSDESGFCTGNNNSCDWNNFNNIITPLNVATKLNLIVVFASCYGASFANSIEVTVILPAGNSSWSRRRRPGLYRPAG